MKHLCLAHKDEQLGPFLEDHGLEGYGFWWLLLEQIGAPVEKNSAPSLVHSEVKWAQNLYTSVRTFRKFRDSLVLRRLILCELVDDNQSKRLKITVPNLLKYRDEYQKKSGQTPDKLRRVSEHRTEQNRAEQTTAERHPKKSAPSVRGFMLLRDAYHQGNRPTTELDWKRAAEAVISSDISDSEIEAEVVPWVRDELSRTNMPRKFYAPETLFKLDVKPWKPTRSVNGHDPCLSNLPTFKPVRRPEGCE